MSTSSGGEAAASAEDQGALDLPAGADGAAEGRRRGRWAGLAVLLHDDEDTAPLYLMGHPEELIPRFQARIDAGVEELTFNLLAPDPRQLDLFMNEIRPHLRPRLP